MKRFILLSALLITTVITKAQNGFDYQPFSAGGGMGITTAYGNTQTTVNKYAYNINFNYNVTPYYTYTIELQTGTLAGGQVTDFNARRFSNDYIALLAHADMQAGELIDYEHNALLNGLKNLYAGVGLGVLSNKITYIQTVIPVGQSNLTTYPYLPSSVNVLLPIRFGYDFKIFNGYERPQYRVDLAYNFNTAFGKGLDGYTTLSTIKFYGYLSLGVKISFGNVLTYRKPIPYYGL